jgi:hypothetical protein
LVRLTPAVQFATFVDSRSFRMIWKNVKRQIQSWGQKFVTGTACVWDGTCHRVLSKMLSDILPSCQVFAAYDLYAGCPCLPEAWGLMMIPHFEHMDFSSLV